MMLFALKYWKLILAGVGFLILGIMLWDARSDARHWQKKYDSEREAYTLFAERVKTKSEEIVRKALERNIRVERRQTEIASEVSNEYAARLAGYDRTIAGLLAKGRTNPRGGGNPMPGVPSAAGSIAREGDGAFVPAADLRICATNTAKAIDWLNWYEKAAAVER